MRQRSQFENSSGNDHNSHNRWSACCQRGTAEAAQFPGGASAVSSRSGMMTVMSGQIWVALISVSGVVAGGALSYLVQYRTQRSAEHAEQRRHEITLTQARRAERMALLERFIEVAAQAERSAFTRPASGWEDTDDWYLRTQDIMNKLWVAERLIRVQFPLPVHDAARAYFLDLNRTVWEGLPDGDSVRVYLENNRLAFLDTARAVMG